MMVHKRAPVKGLKVQMSTIGDRLRSERERLGLSQTDMAEFGGCKKRTQINYEGNERSPDAEYLHGIAKAGADVGYIITGIRSAEASLAPREAALLDNYRHTDDHGKAVLEAAALAAAKPIKKPSLPSIKASEFFAIDDVDHDKKAG